MEMLKRLVVEEEGADATEYALLAALIAVAIIIGAELLGQSIGDMFQALGEKIQAETASGIV